MMTASIEHPPASDSMFQNQGTSGESVFCTQLDQETVAMLDEIRSKFSKETTASILSKAIRQLHDQTCRTLIRNA